MTAAAQTALDYRRLPQLSGYRIFYSTGMHCPGCGGTHWHRGRSSAECARCATALPLAHDVDGAHS